MLNRLSGCLAITVATLLTVSAPTADAPVPSPESVLGFAPCADYTLATSEQIARYLRRLDDASDRMQLLDIGPTTEGRRQLLAVISSEDNLRHLSRYKDIARALALNRDAAGRPLGDGRARRLARDGKAMVWIDFGLHSNEVAPAQTAPWLAWTMVTAETADVRAIRNNVILVLAPDMNPDGTTMMADWYMSHRGEPWDMSLPALYHRYAGHDNNRDWFMFTQAESRNVAKQLYEEYLPQIVYDHHQSAPFPARIFVPPFTGPANVHIPALVMHGIGTLGQAISRRLEVEGKTGAISRVGFDTWWNGGMRTAPYFHNMVGILTETGDATPAPAEYDPAAFPRQFAGGQPTLEPSADYPHPYRGGRWTFRQSCDYMLSASMAVLGAGARLREAWQYDAYQMARDAMRAGAHETYIVPPTQWDPGAAVRMINTLRIGGVAVEHATAAFTTGSTVYPKGSYIIRGAQPFLPYVRDLLNPQHYPERHFSPNQSAAEPYDVSGWTLSLQMGIAVDKVTDTVTAPVEQVAVASLPPGAIAGPGRAFYVLDPRTNEAFVAVNRLLKAGARIARTTGPSEAHGLTLEAGAFLVSQDSIPRERVAQLARELALQVTAIDDAPPVQSAVLTSPRVALYNPWGGNTDEGWTRWVLDQYEFPYAVLRDDAVRTGHLRASFDVIVLPDATFAELVGGVRLGALPEVYTGGMTEDGVRHLREFVIDGGSLVAQSRASELPLRSFRIAVDERVSRLGRSEFNIPGTLLRLDVNNRHPLAWGMPSQVAAFFADSQGFQTRPDAGESGEAAGSGGRPTVVASYPDAGLLLSGSALGERHLRNKAAVVDAPLGAGHVILIGFPAQHRGQSHATFKLLFNAIYQSSARILLTTSR